MDSQGVELAWLFGWPEAPKYTSKSDWGPNMNPLASKPYIIGSLGPKAFKYESFEGKGSGGLLLHDAPENPSPKPSKPLIPEP